MTPIDAARFELEGFVRRYLEDGFFLDPHYIIKDIQPKFLPVQSLRKTLRSQAKQEKRPFVHVRPTQAYDENARAWVVDGWEILIPKTGRAAPLATMFLVQAKPARNRWEHPKEGSGVLQVESASLWRFILYGKSADGLFNAWRKSIQTEPVMRHAIGLPPLTIEPSQIAA